MKSSPITHYGLSFIISSKLIGDKNQIHHVDYTVAVHVRFALVCAHGLGNYNQIENRNHTVPVQIAR